MQKTNVVVLHGWGHDSSYWSSFRNLLQSSRVNVLLLDLPGFGKSKLVSDDWGVPEYANWVKEEVAARELSNVVLLGHSFGGRIATLIAADRPKWLSGLILYASPSLYKPSLVIKTKKILAKLVGSVNLNFDFAKPNELVDAQKKGLDKVFRKVVVFDQTKSLAKISVPTLLVWGDKDEAVPIRIGKEMNSLIINSRLEILENLGHNAHLENPNLFFGVIKSYVENL